MSVRAHPHPEIRALAEANDERLHHFRADLFWTISTAESSEIDPYRYATYHSPLGSALIEVGKAEDEACRLTARELQVVTLGAIGLSVGASGKKLYLSGDTVRTYRKRTKQALGLTASDGPGIEPSVVHCFNGNELSVVLPLSKQPEPLKSERIQTILTAIGQGATGAEIATKLGTKEDVIKTLKRRAFGSDRIIRSTAEALTLHLLSPKPAQQTGQQAIPGQLI